MIRLSRLAVTTDRGVPWVSAASRRYLFSVAQICNLLYRRFVIGKAWKQFEASQIVSSPQNAILRYTRLKICATTLNAYKATVLMRWQRSVECSDCALIAFLLALARCISAEVTGPRNYGTGS